MGTTARGLLMLRLSPRLMLRLDTTVDTMDTVPMDMVFPHTTDTVPMATATLPTLDMATTTARGLLMPRPSPRLMLRLTTMVDMDTQATLTDTVPMATPPMPDTATTTARGPLMLRPGPHMPTTHMLTVMSALPLLPATLLSPPLLPAMPSTSSTSVMPMLRPSPRLMLRLTTMVDTDTQATLTDTVPTAMVPVLMVTATPLTATAMAANY